MTGIHRNDWNLLEWDWNPQEWDWIPQEWTGIHRNIVIPARMGPESAGIGHIAYFGGTL